MLMDEADRPEGIGGKAVQVLRGYPYAAVLSLVILFLLVVAPIFKLRTIIKRWEDAHIPIVIKPDRYEQRGERPRSGRRRRRAGPVSRAGTARARGAVTPPRRGRRRERPAARARAHRHAARPRPRGDHPPLRRRHRRRRRRRSPAHAPPSPIGSRRPRPTSPPARSRRRSRTPSSRCATLRIAEEALATLEAIDARLAG